MMKWKPRGIDSYLIVGYKEETDIYGVPKNTLGSLLLETDGEQFSVSAGAFDHVKKQELWQIRDSLIGQYATVKYPELTDRGIPNHSVIVDITEERRDLDEDN